MKRVKHLITVILILAVAILPTGCGGPPEPAEFLNTVYEKTEDLLAVQGSMDVTMIMDYFGESVEYEMLMDIAADFTDMENPKAAYAITVKSMGISMEMNTYYIDDYMYMDVMGMKIKEKVPVDVLDDYSDYIMMPDIDEVFDVELNEVDGNYQITFTLSEEGAMNLLNELLASSGEMLDLGEMKDFIEIGEISYSLIADKDGIPLSEDISMEMGLTFEGESMEMSLKANSEYTATGDDVVVEFPDLSEYIESEIPTEV